METCQSGVYMIVHRDSGKTYVGSTGNFDARKKQHWRKLLSGRHGNTHLQNAVTKYGIDSFDFVVVELVAGGPDACLEREQVYLNACSHQKERHYNLCWTACGNVDYTNPATSEKLSQSMKRAWATPETRERNRLAAKKKWSYPAEHQRLSDTVKVLMNDPERRARHSEAMQRAWKDPQTRERLLEGSKKRTGMTYAPRKETTPEARAHRQEATRNAWKDPMLRLKHSNALKRAWARRKAAALENIPRDA